MDKPLGSLFLLRKRQYNIKNEKTSFEYSDILFVRWWQIWGWFQWWHYNFYFIIKEKREIDEL